MSDDPHALATDPSAGDRSALAREFAERYARDAQVQSGVSDAAARLLKEYIDTYLQQEAADLPPVSSVNSGLVDAIESELGLQVSDPALRPLIQAQIEAFTAGQRAASTSTPVRNIAAAEDPIEMFSGQFVQEATDLVVRGAGLDFAFKRIYRNHAIYAGPLGAGWDHCYNSRIRQWGDRLLRSSGSLREDLYTRHPLSGQAGFDYWVPPDGQHGVIHESGGSFSWRSTSGLRQEYEQDPSEPLSHRLTAVRDRFGNYLALGYAQGLLTRVEVNHPARWVVLEYDALDRISALSDYSRRRWRYDYDDYGDLVRVVTPATDDHPAGLATCYEYTSSDLGAPLQHNLVRIIDPAGQLYLENEYGIDVGLLSFNRVIRQRQGDGESLLEYERVVEEFELSYNPAKQPAIQVNHRQRNGQMVHHVFNRSGNTLMREEVILRPGAGSQLARWRYRFNADGALTAKLSPEGCLTQYHYGREDYLTRYNILDDEVATHTGLTASERMSFGNLLAVVHRGTRYDFATLNLALGVWGDIFPDAIAALGAEDVVIKNVFEPDYQQVLSTSDPRFTARADPRYSEGPGYGQHLTRFEYSAMPEKQLVRIRYPDTTFPALLPSGATGLAGISEEYLLYDSRGRVQQVQDPEGNIAEYTYVQGGPAEARDGLMSSSIRDAGALRLAVTYDYNSAGVMTGVTNARGFRTTFVVNALDQVTAQIVDSTGFRTQFRFDENGLLERRERDNLTEAGLPAPDGLEVRTYAYDDQNNLIKETSGGVDLSGHHRIRHRYDAAGYRVATINPLGNRTDYRYDERGLLRSVTRGAGTAETSTTRTVHDLDGRPVRSVDGRGNVTIRSFDPLGRYVETVDPIGTVHQYAYDKRDNVVLDRVFETQSDGNHYLLQRSRFDYDERGSRTRSTAYLFNAPILTADITGAPDAEFLAAQAQGTVAEHSTLQFYDRNGRLFRRTDAGGQSMQWGYDGANRRFSEEDSLGNFTLTEYDENSNVVRVDRHELILDPVTGAPFGEEVFTTVHDYDALDRRIRTTDGLGNSTTFGYDSRDNPVSVTDPLGNVRRRHFDVFNRMVTDVAEMTTTGLGNGQRLADIVTQYIYDANDRLEAIVDARGIKTEFGYDSLDRRINTTLADASSTVTSYDADDHVVAVRDNNGLRMVRTIDPLGRCTRLDLDLTLLDPRYPYPTGAETYEECSYDGLGRSLTRTNELCVLTSQFDSLGRAHTERIRFATALTPPAGDLVLGRVHDAMSNRSDLTYPDGRVVHYDFDQLNRVERISNTAVGAGYPGSAGMPAGYNIATFEYAGTRIARARYGNGAGCDWSYDGAARVVGIHHTAAGATLLEIQQLFDAAGNRRLQLDLPVQPLRPNGETYDFDSAYRLTGWARQQLGALNLALLAPPGAPMPVPALQGQQLVDALLTGIPAAPPDRVLSYDNLGNRQSEAAAGQPVVTLSSNDLNQIETVGATSLRYDLNGNLIDDGVFEYQYNYRNQLSRIVLTTTTAEVLRLGYDAAGRLVHLGVPAQSTLLVNDGTSVIAEYRGGIPVAQYVYGRDHDQLCQHATGGQEAWHHADLLETTRLLSDGQGQALTPRYEYEPFGVLVGGPASSNPYLFAGKRLLPQSGLYDCLNRQYKPALGRFIQRDPLGTADGINLYTYAANNPLAFVDPLGTEKAAVSPTLPDQSVRPLSERERMIERRREYEARSIAARGGPRTPEDYQALLGVPRADDPARWLPQYAEPAEQPQTPFERDLAVVKTSIYAIGTMLISYYEIAEYLTRPAQFMLLVPGATKAAGGVALAEFSAFERAAARNVFNRTALTLQDEMALQAAKEGAGELMLRELGDPRFLRMEKWNYTVKSREGLVSDVHYVRDKVGRGTWEPGGPPGLEDFKFKRSSGDTLTKYELTPEPKVSTQPSGFPPPKR